MNRDELVKNQENMLNNLDAAKERLLKIKGVLAVGIGMKETDNEFTDQISFRVYVREKKDKSELSENEIIPDEINGIKTDVLTPRVFVDDSDVCGDERRTLSEHRPLQAGIAVSTKKNRYGTLGWFGALDADDTPILLTNKHVLYDYTSEVTTEKLPTAQPRLGEPSKCCCCECGSDNVIGESIIGIRDTAPLTSASVDCAIAKINPEHASNISLRITNNSTEEVLSVAGNNTAVVGETVRKIGARSGFTRGVVIHLGDLAAVPADPGGGTIEIWTGQVMIIPHATETYQVREGVCKKAFSNKGDSGAVILNDSDEIIALNWNGNRTDYSVGLTLASSITNVLNAFSANGFPITLSTSPPGGGDADFISSLNIPRKPVIKQPVPESNELQNILEKLRDANRHSLLYKLYEKHFHEVMDLVNHKRPVTVAWHRNQGPAFVAAIARAVRVDAFEIPFEIEGINRETLLKKMGAILSEHGSVSLQNDISIFGPALLDVIANHQSIEEIAHALLAISFIDEIPDEIKQLVYC